LNQTGREITVGKYALACLGVAIAVGGLIYFKELPPILAAVVGLAAGAYIPHAAVNMMIKKRIKLFNVKFPDAIELMVRGLRSGLPISETMTIVASEIEGPVGVEFKAVADRIRIGRTMDEALQEAADRLGTAEFQFFCITLAIQRETGGNLAETLSNLADVLRKRAQMLLKIRALSSEAKASAYIVGALPFIVYMLVSWMNPEYTAGFYTEQRLMIAGGVGIVWMSIGGFIMYKMVNFDF
jgi:tight adherence protein B